MFAARERYCTHCMALVGVASALAALEASCFCGATRLAVDAATAHTKALFVEFYSSAPLSYPILLARRGNVPRLDDGWLPSVWKPTTE